MPTLAKIQTLGDTMIKTEVEDGTELFMIYFSQFHESDRSARQKKKIEYIHQIIIQGHEAGLEAKRQDMKEDIKPHRRT